MHLSLFSSLFFFSLLRLFPISLLILSLLLRHQNVTVLRYKTGLFTWLLVGILCLFTFEFCCCCCALIPLCINATKDVEHVHPVTGQVVGVYSRI